jgi:hypothetical protein
MKVLVLNGSPKKKSNTMQLTTAFLDGLKCSKEYHVKIETIFEKNVQYCQGCMQCWITEKGRCVFNDDLNEVLDNIAESDVVIWSFPLYVHGFPAHLKAVLDRTIPFLKAEITRVGGIFDHDYAVDMSTKRWIVISGCGFPAFEENFAPLRLQCNNYFKNPTMICVPETALLGFPGADKLTAPLLSKFKEAGEEFSAAGCLSDKTVHSLESPMLPSEHYVSMYNEVLGRLKRAYK